MDINKLKGVIPDSVIAQIPDVMTKFSLNTSLRLSHFLAQCSHESMNFKAINENLNYSANRLMAVFPKYFSGKNLNNYGGNPQKIANLIYGNRMGNGDEASGDGYKYHGRGYIQLTGKDNYKAFGAAIGKDLITNPDLVATTYPLLSAAWFFSKNGLGAIADKGASADVVTQITKRVNGGTIGLDDRINKFNKFYKLLQ